MKNHIEKLEAELQGKYPGIQVTTSARGIPLVALRERYQVDGDEIHIDGYGPVAANATHQVRPNVTMMWRGKPVMLQLHRLRWILEHGWLPVGKRPELRPGRVYYELDHVSGDTADYSIDNLECVTHAENMRRSFEKRRREKVQPKRKALLAEPPCPKHARFESDDEIQESHPGIRVERGFQGSEGFIPIEEWREAFRFKDGEFWRKKDGGWRKVKIKAATEVILIRYDCGEDGRNHRRVLAYQLAWALERGWAPAPGCGWRFTAVNGDLRDFRLENLLVVKELGNSKTKALRKARRRSKSLRTDKSLTTAPWHNKELWTDLADRVKAGAERRRRDAWREIDEAVDLAELRGVYPGVRIQRSLNGISLDSFREVFYLQDGQVARRNGMPIRPYNKHGRHLVMFRRKYVDMGRLTWLLAKGWVPAAQTPKGEVWHVIHHADSDPRNNHPDNLECVTAAENIALVKEWPNRPGRLGA